MVIFKNHFKIVLRLMLVLLVSFASLTPVSAQEGRVPSPPTFPRCEQKLQEGSGDISHDTSGVHTIPGRGSYEGRSDIYSLTGSNYIQCFCPVNADNGIQLNWWNIEGLPLGRVDIDAYVRDGWVRNQVNGNLNLDPGEYLVKSEEFTCSQTITPTRGQISRTPTITAAQQNSCPSFRVSPQEGTAPLSVTFTYDPRNSSSIITEFEFDFGDSENIDSVVRQSSSESAHIYNNPGTYIAKVRIKNANDEWSVSDNCQKTIKVRAKPEVMDDEKPDEMPATGIPLSVFFGFIIVAEAGYLLYKRFELV